MSVELETELISVTKQETLYTHDPEVSYRIAEGTAYIYIVPWDTDKNAAGRRIYLCEAEQGRVIPALAFRDQDYKTWRFEIAPKEGELSVNKLPSTSVLKKKFLVRVLGDGVQRETFEYAMAEYYNLELFKEAVGFIRKNKGEGEILEQSKSEIVHTLKDKELPEDGGSVKASELYKVVRYACKKRRLSIAEPQEIANACGKDPEITDIARLSNFICRTVVLDPKWYESDCGVIIAKHDKHWIACIPKGSHYMVYEDGKSLKRLTAAYAAEIEPSAYSIGKSLPQEKLDGKKIRQFCLESLNGSDIAGIVVLGLLGAVIGVLLPTLNQKIYDEYIPMGEFNLLFQMGLLIGSFMIGNLFLSLVKKLLEFRTTCHVSYALQSALYDRIFQLPESFFRSYDSADLAQRLMGTENMAGSFMNMILSTGFSTAFSLVYLIRMFTYSAKLAVVGLLMVMLFAVVVFFLQSRSMKYEKKITEVDGEAVSRLYQFLGGIQKIRMAGVEERFIFEYMKPFSRKQFYGIKLNHIAAAATELSELGTYIFSMVLYFVVVNSSIDVSTGSFIAFNTAFGTFAASILGLTSGLMSVIRMKPEYERIRPVLETAPESNKEGKPVSTLNGGIELEHVTFSYSEGGRNILNDFSLSIKPKEYVAFVGPSGCGKSTLLKLMLGFEKPMSGRICYDNQDMKDLDKHSLRRNLGVVLQNGKLISGSIYDNVTITAPKTSMKEVNEVIDAVGLKDDIAQMPMGLHTVLSESGSTISGGQQQRILIARSIMNHPKILFFDEATSALDNLTQAKVCEHLDTMDITRIVIAHRLSTIKNCDRIVVIKDGHIDDQGSYEELMEKRGLFYQMASRQLTE